MPHRKVALEIVVSDDNHCSNDCAGMSHDAQQCHFFSQPLSWDKRRRLNGNHRLPECKTAESLKSP